MEHETEVENLRNEIRAISGRVEEIAEVMALLNEKLTFLLDSNRISVASVFIDSDRKTWQKLSIKPIKELTKQELLDLNEKVSDRHIGSRVFSTDSVKQPSYEEISESYAHLDGGYDHAILALLKNVIHEKVYGTRREYGYEPTEADLVSFLTP